MRVTALFCFSESGTFANYKRTKDLQWAKCTRPECCKLISTAYNSQKGLKAHDRHHTRIGKDSSRPSGITVKLITLLGLSFTKAHHPLIQELLADAGREPVRSRQAVVAELEREYDATSARLKEQLQALKEQGAKFAFSTDECQLVKKRFLCVILHSSLPIELTGCSTIHLGLIRLRGKAPAEILYDAITEVFRIFGLVLEDFCGMTTDGASVMIKLGMLMKSRSSKPFFPIICLAHGLNLGVQDCFKNTRVNYGTSVNQEADEFMECFHASDFNVEQDVEDCDVSLVEQEEVLVTFDGEYGVLMTAVMNMCKEVAASTISHDQFLDVQLEVQARELSMLLANSTRWDGHLRVLKRVLEVWPSLEESFRRSPKPFPLGGPKLAAVREMVQVLELVYSVSQVLQKENCTLAEADKAFEYLLVHLREASTKSGFAKIAFHCIARRVAQRRTLVYGLARFAADATFHFPIEEVLSAIPEYRAGRTTRCVVENELLNFKAPPPEPPAPTLDPLTFRNVTSYLSASAPQKGRSELTDVQVVSLAVSTHLLHGSSPIMSAANSVLRALQPTSAAPERMFSLAKHLRTQYRGQLGDERFGKLMFMRFIYLNKYKCVV